MTIKDPSTDSFVDPADELLRHALSAAHFGDDGFVARVTSALPRKRRRLTRRDFVIAASFVAAGVVGAVLLAIGGIELSPVSVDALRSGALTSGGNQMVAQVGALALLAVLGLWGAWSLASD